MEKLQFISQENAGLSHLASIEKACKAGVKWVQLRIKNKPAEEIIPLARQAKNICDNYGAKLIINDHPSVALTVSAYGVHVGKADVPVKDARKVLGDKFIIGGTANTIEDIEKHWQEGADYVGVGPFRFTTTKEKLSPILGLEGYSKITSELKRRNISIPVIAIGGIELNDIKDIMKTGVHGIAVSSLIASAEDAGRTADAITKTIYEPLTSGAC